MILLRHGESQWNQENRFTGWVDVDLSEKGIKEAKQAGALIAKEGLEFNKAYTSYLLRAWKTLYIALEVSKRFWLPIHPAWELNERHYGALAGLNKKDTADKYGEEQVKIWRRSYATLPPLLEDDDPNNPAEDIRYQYLTKTQRPKGESLALTVDRVAKYFQEVLQPSLLAGNLPLISAHGNSLRAMVKYLEDMSEADVLELNIPTGVPLIYELEFKDNRYYPISKRYLGDSTEVEARLNAVANQGKK